MDIEDKRNFDYLIKKERNMAKKYYAVKNGREPGIYTTWDQCKAQVNGFSGAIYKSFPSKEEAEAFIGGAGASLDKINELTGGAGASLDKINELTGSAGASLDKEKDDFKKREGVLAYVDGSYNISTKEFSYGMIIIMEDGIEYKYAEKYSDPELASMRNVAGEIKGAQAAMEFAIDRKIEKITIFHDYEGIARWCLGEWKTNKEGTIAYKAYYDSIKDRLDVDFVKVKGHSNDKYNDIADELAKQAVGVSCEIHQLDMVDFH